MSEKNPGSTAGAASTAPNNAASSAKPDTTTPSATGAIKEWYVLVGMSGRCLKTAEVKGLYEAKKVTIRGPYTWEDLLKYHSNGMVKADCIVYKKGELEWIPFELHHAGPVDEGAKEEVAEEQVKEWYVLAGIAGKILESTYVKELYDKGQVKVRGPYTKGEVVKLFQDDLIGNDTMIYRKGDRDWKPFAKQEIGSFQEVVKSIIFDAGVEESGEFTYRNARLANAVQFLHSYRRSLAVTFALAVAALIAWPYYYYSTEKIYGRIKKSVVVVMCDGPENRNVGLGSGFIIDGSGLIVTNLHVVEKASSVRIKAGDDVTYPVEGVVKIDPKNDIAVLKVTKGAKVKELPSIQIAEADKLEIGDRVYTIGNPGGLEFSLSEGIVSGQRSEDPVTKKSRELIQITAPISPGNSGGPVLDKKGRVIGISTLGSRNDYQNLNFAVPVKLVGKTDELKQVIIKYLPWNPQWKSLGTRQLAEVNFGDGATERRLDFIEAYYDERSLTRISDSRVRLWLKVIMSYGESNYRYSAYLTPQKLSAYCLSEIDCSKGKYRYNIAFATNGSETSSMNANFDDDNKWQNINEEDKLKFDEICRPQY